MNKKLTPSDKMLLASVPRYFANARVIKSILEEAVHIIVPNNEIEKDLEKLVREGHLEKSMIPVYRKKEG